MTNPRALALWTVLAILVFSNSPLLAGGEFPLPHRFYGEHIHGETVSGWEFDINGDGLVDYKKLDTTGDGVIDLHTCDRNFDGLFEKTVSSSVPPPESRRHVIICVDSIPYALMEELWLEGHFRDFHPPSRLISTFPSDTNPAMTEIFNTARTPGVEDHYYDRRRDRVVGGIWDHIVRPNPRTDRTFHSVFDYEQHPRYGAMMYLNPYLVSDHDLRKFRENFWKLYFKTPPDRTLMLYIGSTDAIGHTKGGEGMRRQLLRFERILDEIIYETMGDVRISLFSDHGDNLIRSERRIALGKHLAIHGFRLAGSLKGLRDVVVPAFGLVGDVCIYTRKENKARLAEVLSTLDGVDFALYEHGGEIHVAGKMGKAKIIVTGERYGYEIIEGDPLMLKDVVAGLKEDGEIDSSGLADDEAWFEATIWHLYPDILKRLLAAATNHVAMRPDIFLSLEEGYCYGSAFFLKAIDLKGVHGSARDTQSLGMAMSTSFLLPTFIRNADLLEALGEPELKRSDEASPPETQKSPIQRRQVTIKVATLTPAPKPTSTPIAALTPDESDRTPTPTPSPTTAPATETSIPTPHESDDAPTPAPPPMTAPPTETPVPPI